MSNVGPEGGNSDGELQTTATAILQDQTSSGGPSPAEYPASFPSAFITYCKANGIPGRIFRDIPWETIRSTRFVRLRPGLEDVRRERLLEALSAERVPWLPCDAYRIPRSIPMGSCQEYQNGRLCPMDAASMAAVVALRVQPGDRVLDLCCCPGMKTLLIADALLASSDRSTLGGSVVGVDVSMDRLLVARSLIAAKHRMQSLVSLVCCDGRTYDPVAMMHAAIQSPSMDAKSVDSRVRRVRKFMERERKRRRGEQEPCSIVTSPEWVLYSDAEAQLASAVCQQQLPGGGLLFDKVLVDVECTHDGSLLHLDIAEGTMGPPVPETTAMEGGNAGRRCCTVGAGGITNAQRMERMNYCSTPGGTSELHTLQLALLTRGFECLKPGGLLVYSTCSFSEAQNEEMVETFLRTVNASSQSLVCVPEVPFLQADGDDTTRAVSPLIALCDNSKEALRQVVTLTTKVISIEQDGPPPMHTSVSLTTARFWPHKSLTSFQFIAVLRRV